MGGKRVSGRSSSGEAMHPRISSAGSTKSYPIESTSVTTCFYPKRDFPLLNGDFDDDVRESSSLDLHRKNSFDIISLLETHDTNSKRENEKLVSKGSDTTTELPSFWHFVEPDTRRHDVFHRAAHPHHDNGSSTVMFPSSNCTDDRLNGEFQSTKVSSATDKMQVNTGVNYPKRAVKRRKVKKVQSAKVAGFKSLERSSERLGRRNHEWLRVLTPPGTDSASLNSVNNDSEEDELIRRYFSGLSSAGSSISWAEDAMESEFTTQLMKLWEDIESVCAGETRPEKMSNAVYEECMQWRKAFPNPDLHRFSSFRNEGDLSPVESPTLGEDRADDADVAFSSLGQSSSPRSFNGGRKGYEENLSLVQANFRTLNCSTPRPNIEKSTEYVSAWLSECQNSSVPEGDKHFLLGHNSSKSVFPLLHAINSADPDREVENSVNKSRHSLRLGSDGMKSSYGRFSRNHTKFVNEPDPSNFFTSLAITNNEKYNPLESKVNSAFVTSSISNTVPDINNLTFGESRFSSSYQSRINESDEEDDGSSTPTEIVSFRPNVRVQRPISSRVRDHAITPIATSSYMHSSFGGRHSNINKQIPSASLPNAHLSENYRYGGRLRMFESLNTTAVPASANADVGTGPNRIKSGLVKQGHSYPSQFGRTKQQPWSRHSGEDLAAEANYVTSLYENYPSGIRNNIEEESTHEITSINLTGTGPNHSNKPNSAKGSYLYDRSRGIDGPHSLAECEDQPYKPAISWLMNR